MQQPATNVSLRGVTLGRHAFLGRPVLSALLVLGTLSIGADTASVRPAAHSFQMPSPTAITAVTVVDGTSRMDGRPMTVIIRDGAFAAVEPAAGLPPPADALLVDGRGRYLVPGLWDMHVHLAKSGVDSLALFVANGVTSVRDMGGDFELVRGWRADVAAGRLVGPRIRTAGPMLESADRVRRMKARGTVEPVDRFRVPVSDPGEAARAVEALAHLGVDFVKVRTVASQETYEAIARAAAGAGLALAGHGDVAPPDVMLRAGQQSIEHAIHPSLDRLGTAERARFIARLASGGVAIVPTMINYYEWMLVPPGDARRAVEDAGGRLDPRRRYISGYLLDDWREQIDERGGVRDALLRRVLLPRAYGGVLKDLRDMHRAGVRFLPGTDVAVALMYPGFSLRDELRYFVDDIGMSPMEALASATMVSAEFSGAAASLGTIEVGKLADAVLLSADPRADIRNLQHIEGVVLGGRWFDRAALDALLQSAVR
ncbi:MAG: amidohydrolase family protein [Vicinamibacterales bacterium]|nr:amidohydrolase family protein [Vicinamibacterales bacterium]